MKRFCIFLFTAMLSVSLYAQYTDIITCDVSDNEGVLLSMLASNEMPVTHDVENSNAKKEVLILLAHPDIASSKANAALLQQVKDLDYVKVINIYEAPFEPATYTEAFREANHIVFQFPFYWASAPHLLKKWCDEIFGAIMTNPGIKGKTLTVATTTGSEYEAYRSGGRNMFTMDELLRPYQVLANHSGMVWQTPFVLYGEIGRASCRERG